MCTLEEAFSEGKLLLTKAKIEEANLDAWYLLEHCFGITRMEYFMNPKRSVTKEQTEAYFAAVQKRSNRIPLSHITGERDFFGYTFYVNENVLIPRQETEVLVEEVLKVCQGKRVLDLCTGSGCIAITIAKEGQPAKVAAVDISSEALDVAKQNATKLNANVSFIYSDLYEQVEETYDIIVSNPPYIKTKEIQDLMPEVRLHEPMLALDGMSDGLDFYRRIIKDAKRVLNPNGRIFFEIGYDQGEDVKALLMDGGFSEVKVLKDLTERDRVVCAIYR